MRRTGSDAPRGPEGGFTLIELIVSITLVGILAVVAVPMLRVPMVAYTDATQRALLASEMDASVGKMRDDLAQAMPNSVRVRQVGARQFLEYLPVRMVGRYRAAAPTTAIPLQCPATCSGAGNNDVLQFASCNESCFTALGQPQGAPPVAGADWVVVNPIATTATPGLPGVVSQDPYFGGATSPPNGVKSRLLTYTPAAGHRITMTPHQFPAPPAAASRQFYVVGTPVSYECNPATGRLTRHDGYAIAAVQPTAFPAGGAPLATSIAACTFRYDATGGPGRGGLVSVWLRFSQPSAETRQPESIESFSEFSVREPG